MDEAEGSGAWAQEGIGVCGRVAPLAGSAVENDARAPEADGSEVNGSCEPGALGATVEVACARQQKCQLAADSCCQRL